MSLRKVVDCIKRNKRFLITAHINLEGDALGSEIAFSRLLKALGKHATIVNQDNVPAEYNFLSAVKKIKKLKKNLRNIKSDCLVVLDCSDLNRCGEVSKINRGDKIILNIDHHISNQRFGDINWIELTASSTSEMIYRLYKKLHVNIDKETAVALYVGMLTDTGSFRYPNTTSLTHRIVSELMRYNLDIAHIYKNVYENIPFREMKLLSKILPTINSQLQGKIAWFQIKGNFFKKHKHLSFDLTEQVLNFARAIKEVEVAVMFKENLGPKNEVRVNLRSQGKIDVNRIARFFSGGGHKTASGFTVKGRIEQVRRKVLAKIRESFK